MPPKGWRKNAGMICGKCWPDGWPHPMSTSAGCEHGTWSRMVEHVKEVETEVKTAATAEMKVIRREDS